MELVRSTRWILLPALLLATGCLDTSVPFQVTPESDVTDAAHPDTTDTVGGETAVDLVDDGPDPEDIDDPLDTPDPQDTSEEVTDTEDPDLHDTTDTTDTADGGDTPDTPGPDTPCIPDCVDKECGDDGCDGDCGACDDGLICEGGLCIFLEDSLSCEDRCGEPGNNCDCDEACFSLGSCCGDICLVFCADLLGCTCGDEACEGSETCETCPTDCGCGDGALCLDGACCTPDCQGKECGGDGCGGGCGECTGPQEACVGGACVCQPDCDGLACGPDGCGGDCGICEDPFVCTNDACDSGACITPIGPYFCLIDGACVPSGAENLSNSCEQCKPLSDQEAWTPREDGVPCGATATCWQGICCDPVANCTGKECGDDNCGWVCGGCGVNEACGGDGLCGCAADSVGCDGVCCEPGQVCDDGAACCFPACGGKNCGPNGCGGDCGTCAGLQDLCVDGLCACQPDCAGLECGPDGCGGNCGACPGPQDLCVEGLCGCQPACAGKTCGPDGCDGTCGACDVNETCAPEGVCKCVIGGATCAGGCCAVGETCFGGACCAPSCEGSVCGDNGCGGDCGTCTGSQEACVAGLCVCQPACIGKSCGPDGCGGDCGTCEGAQNVCLGGACVCHPDCLGKECGPDGCGGSCGACDDGLSCTDDGCEGGLCVAPIGPDFCLIDGACEASGTENPVNPCEACTPAADQETWTPLEEGASCGADLVCFQGGCCPAGSNCTGKECGPDGCGGSCGDCGDPQDTCVLGLCVCQPACAGKNCGPDGCGATCGACGVNEICTPDGVCECAAGGASCGDACCVAGEICFGGACCTPDCAGTECGSDGCGGACGDCDDDLSCTEDACEGGLCVAPVESFSCLIDVACAALGEANPSNPCESCQPETTQETWTPREDGAPCGGTATCWQGSCCDAVTNCAGKECGDDGCGWVCGACSANEICGGDALCACAPDSVACDGGCCEPGQVCHGGACCFPACGGKNCGPDGCGGSCGTCAGPLDLCVDGLCECQPACAGLDCGPDGCGGSCGDCSDPLDACVGGLCACQPACAGKSCGPDGCGDVCGVCGENQICRQDEGLCECAPGGMLCGGGCCLTNEVCFGDACCAPDCAGLECGDDGCGSDCGVCGGDQDLCVGGTCVCQAACAGKECGPDGCGGDCGVCPDPQDACLGGACVCESDCLGKECGPDGCGGTCGACDDGLDCTQDACDGGACGVTILSDACLIPGAGCVAAGALNPGNPCEYCLPLASQTAWTILGDGTDCGNGMVCFEGSCCDAAANCAGLECGDDGCGGTCGACDGLNGLCVDGLCVCEPDCEFQYCGDDGCGGSCGECGENQTCWENYKCACVPDAVYCLGACCAPGTQVCANGACCTPDCAGKDCGDDGCGGDCGTCGDDQVCIGDLCPPPGDQCDDFNLIDWDGCTDGQLTEFQANVETTEDQLNPDVAVNHLDQFLVVWQSKEQDGSDFGVFGRLFDPDGDPVGPEIQINTHTAGVQEDPRTAALGDGRFVVAWTSDSQAPDGDSTGIFARLVGTDGTPQGSEIPVNDYTWGTQKTPDVAGTDEGFLVVWDGQGSGDYQGIWCRAFDIDGAALMTGQERLNAGGEDSIEYTQRNAALAPLGGGAVAVWETMSENYSWQIKGRLLSGPCDEITSQVTINATSSGAQNHPEVAALASGVFLAAFDGKIASGADPEGIGARRASDAGVGLGEDLLVNTTTTDLQETPCVARAGTGFVVAWASHGQDGPGPGIYFQRLSAIGVHAGAETPANAYTANEQEDVAAASFSDGSFVLVWESLNGPDGDKSGIFVRRFDASGAPLYR